MKVIVRKSENFIDGKKNPVKQVFETKDNFDYKLKRTKIFNQSNVYNSCWTLDINEEKDAFIRLLNDIIDTKNSFLLYPTKMLDENGNATLILEIFNKHEKQNFDANFFDEIYKEVYRINSLNNNIEEENEESARNEKTVTHDNHFDEIKKMLNDVKTRG